MFWGEWCPLEDNPQAPAVFEEQREADDARKKWEKQGVVRNEVQEVARDVLALHHTLGEKLPEIWEAGSENVGSTF